ncbi:alkaline phosphatase family protein [Lacibacter cauensis]|nr:alkaline phosphatase family protein [Lacibacter cauensis]
MISLDGTPDYLVDRFLKSGVLPANGAFAKMKKYGAYAETMLPVNVASTGPSHIALFTGASPSKTGIVGNSFRSKDQPWDQPALSAFRQPLQSETIFQAAMRQGKKVMVLGGVSVDNLAPERKVDYMHMYPQAAGPSLLLNLVPTDAEIKIGENYFKLLKVDASSESQPVFEVTGKLKMPLYIYQTDSVAIVANSLQPVKQIIIDNDADLSNGFAASLSGSSWSTMMVRDKEKQYVSSIRILNTDAAHRNVRLFMSAPAEVYGYPDGFLQHLQQTCGYWPGEPENRKQTSGVISEDIWFEQVDRLAKYFRDLIIAGMQTNQWDLLFGYFSTLDDVQHRYTLRDQRQLDYKAEQGKRPARYASLIERYFQKVDNYLLDIMNAAPRGTNFVIVSDHGMIPVHTTVLLNNYMERSGFFVSRKEVKSFSSGTSAHIYINQSLIESAERTVYIKRLAQRLLLLRDSVTGEPVFELVADHEKQKELGLYHAAYSGDLFVSCRAGYSISDRLLSDVPVMVQNSFDPELFQQQQQAIRNFLVNGTMNETGRAVHGNLATMRQGQSIFYALGPDVPRKKLGKIFSLQIAATIADLLGIDPPGDVEMKGVFVHAN